MIKGVLVLPGKTSESYWSTPYLTNKSWPNQLPSGFMRLTSFMTSHFEALF